MQWEKKTNIDQLRFLANPAAGHFWSDGISYTKAEDLHIMHVINQCAQRTLQQCAISAYYNRTHFAFSLQIPICRSRDCLARSGCSLSSKD